MTDSITTELPVSTEPMPTPLKTSVSGSEADKMAAWTKEDLQKGKITQTQADAIFTELNVPVAQRTPDTRTDAEKRQDVLSPPAKESEYTIRYYAPGEPEAMTPELKQFDESARGWMAGAGMPREIGNSLVSQIAKVAAMTERMTPDQLEQYGYSEFEKLQKVHGAKLDARLQSAARMIDVLERERPGLKQFLKSRGIGDNAVVVNVLLSHANDFHAKRGR